ncbi:RhoGAP and Fes/CIP4 domain-containing protein [Coprinopsis sp. MPI-PUGE-AT-0042]|nr:RhoGAP and Fes/CIP4 domain-containing protein [Coprinopsis sp. MPI-PUGE-AT-0042]
MAVLSLPLTFTNSFWSQDYRHGLEVLFDKLEQGAQENDEVVAFIRNRARAEAALADVLINPSLTGKGGKGFDADEGASLLVAFRGLQAESVAEGQHHKSIATELESLVADPFDAWAQGYKNRLRQQRSALIDNLLHAYEQGQAEVTKLKQQYLAKMRKADEAVDDAKFAPNSTVPDTYTLSPRLRPVDKRTAPERTKSVSERIAQRFKEIQKNVVATVEEEPAAEPEPPKVDKGKGKLVEEPSPIELSSPIPLTPQNKERSASTSPKQAKAPPPNVILLAGLSVSPTDLSEMLMRASTELPLRTVRFPLLGEYQDAFTGDELVSWLNANVPGFGGNLDLAEDAARELTEREGLLRRLGELGNQFEHSDDAWYQFRPKAFNLMNNTPESPKAEGNLLKRTGTLVNIVSKALNTNSSNEPAYVRAHQAAVDSDKAYRIAVRKLDRQRLGLEEHIEENLKLTQRWEAERLAAVKTVLLQYQGTLENLPKTQSAALERSATLVAAFQPDSDLSALIERYRTGPFRPAPQVYESVSHDESDVVFGIDLRKWAEGGWYAMQNGEEKKELVPPVFTALMSAIESAYGKLDTDAEKRKTWIYEVPLPAVHHLREALNAVPPDQSFQSELFAQFDAPVIASTLKLWLLELNPPIGLYENWDEFRKLYPNVGSVAAKAEENVSEEERLKNVSSALQRLPRVHLFVLDQVVKHFKDLIASTKVEESDEMYINKLALSFGRVILHPKAETNMSIQDRHPTLLFIDLLKNYDALLPPTIARKKRESERKVPIRKRTAPIDMRLSRSRISFDAHANPQALLAAQKVAQNPSLAGSMGMGSPPLPAPPSAAEKLVPPPPPPPLAGGLVPPPPPPPAAIERLKTPVPPPPPPPSLSAVPPPPPLSGVVASQPPRQFKEPPPEKDDQPPRPQFKEPAKSDSEEEDDDDDDDDDDEDDSDEEESDATSKKAPEPPKPEPTPPPPPPPVAPAADDVTLGSGKAALSRHGSSDATGRGGGVRGPRITRGPRAPSGNVGNLVQNINRTSMSGSPVGGRPPSVGRFQRRTMASDAEDEVVDR